MDTAGPPSPGTPRGLAVFLVAAGLLLMAISWRLASRGFEPFATWLYPFEWYPLILVLEGLHRLRRGRFLFLDRPGVLLSLLAWSVPVWMVFELLNFRVANWFYVFVPDRRPLAWLGIVLSFATVLPAVFLPAALTGLAGKGSGGSPGDGPDPGDSGSEAGRPGAPKLDLALRGAGVLFLVLPLVWPRIFFPLIWGGFLLLAEPGVRRRAPDRSLLADVEEGRFGRIQALLLGGFLAGVFWEALNAGARGRWIYTVPGLEELKLFEMPPLGFLGFPVFALSAFAMYQWLVVHGLARPAGLTPSRTDGEEWKARAAPAHVRVAAGLAGVALVVGTLVGMERWTIASTTPRLRDLPHLLPAHVEDLAAWGISDPFHLASLAPEEVARQVPGVEAEDAEAWVDAARLATTRGMGTRNARVLARWGVESPRALAGADPAELAACFREVGGPRVTPARLRVWQRAARREAGRFPEDSGAPSRSPSGCRGS